MPPSATVPIQDGEFDAAMAACGAAGTGAQLAVAVSGGADSLALAWLAGRWCRRHGASLTALTVDHALRPNSREEAARVAGWMAAWGLAHRILPWLGEKPTSGIQAAGRIARYGLLTDWCRTNGVADLLAGHHRDDQSETVLLRLLAGSGPLGLAGMAPVSDLGGVRLLRPLLSVPPLRLRALLAAIGQPWIEDPSNRDRRFARARLRLALPLLAAAGIDGAAEAERFAGQRSMVDGSVESLLEDAVVWSPLGSAEVDGRRLSAAGQVVGAIALGRILAMAGGRPYTAAADQVERLFDRLHAGCLGGGATLGGCRIRQQPGGRVMIVREARNLPPALVVAGGEILLWDGRFHLRLTVPGAGHQERPLILRTATPADRAAVGTGIPAAAVPWATLPLLADEAGVVDMPHAGYRRGDVLPGVPGFAEVAFRPRRTHVDYGYLHDPAD